MLKYKFDVVAALTEAGTSLSEKEKAMASDANKLDTETLAHFCNILHMTPQKILEEMK